MARLVVEDSDDEFPDLAEILSRKTEVRIPKPESRTKKTVNTDGESPSKRTDSRLKAKRADELAAGKPRPRKRILNPTSNNPLLRPLANLSRGSSESSGSSKSKLDISPERSARRRVVAPRPLAVLDAEAVPENDDSEPEKRAQKKDLRKRTTTPSFQQSSVSEPVSVAGKHVVEPREEPQSMEAREEKAKAPSKQTVIDSDSDDEEFEGASGLSDFIVDDSTFLDEESIILPPPRSSRKLVRGRGRPRELEDSDSEDLGREMARLRVDDDVFQVSKRRAEEKFLEEFANDYREKEPALRLRGPKTNSRTKKDPPRIKARVSTSDLEDPFALRYSPVKSQSMKTSEEAPFVTPPGSPVLQPRKLQSPKKELLRIPATPHRQSTDNFWKQDVVNDWNDEYSPLKVLQPKPNPLPKEHPYPKKSPGKLDREAKEAKKAFSQTKHALADSFLTELDAKITNGEIARLAASTGGVKIIWSKKLNTTAGRANWKRETVKPAPGSTDVKLIHRHHATIELAEKVIDDEGRLLNVLAHEFCHLANFMVSGIKTNPHGKEFKAWAAKCSRHFGDRGIEVTTKHTYSIDYKYVWECVNCSTEFKRHSKSIDPSRHQCGSCRSKLVQTKPVPRANAGASKVSEYQLFVKENMKRLREENPGSPQKEIMGLVGKRYQAFKASKHQLGGDARLESVDIEDDVRTKEGTLDDDTWLVVRKLDFLDLTSP
ncbi:uncharacterized protein L3040_003664 [Drepanopeziza brunnea f. sp. 'multigermtubi']|uniref:uncharacterized protein n=1 Tax=Drepanopeziza brunnea f. sp. 'multigermtubi' TaxID=698441 RepID=UPI0023A6AEF3|nr:hypothetical protein L3040_003664 [Drepanopeziza brunnea f. sp. 'multigermtubi']